MRVPTPRRFISGATWTPSGPSGALSGPSQTILYIVLLHAVPTPSLTCLSPYLDVGEEPPRGVVGVGGEGRLGQLWDGQVVDQRACIDAEQPVGPPLARHEDLHPGLHVVAQPRVQPVPAVTIMIDNDGVRVTLWASPRG